METVSTVSTLPHTQIAQQLVEDHGAWDAYKIGIEILQQATQDIQQNLGGSDEAEASSTNPPPSKSDS